ncbi:MAG: cobalamin-binding protein [Planctomycetota bacterium]|nr:cobalamin-binding protein [Planctomycetota bacterium]
MKICSLLPSATEIVYALGLGDSLRAVTHECDFPPEAKERPTITSSILPGGEALPGVVDGEVRRLVESGEGIYRIDGDLLQAIQPDLILTQKLCEVCAVNYDDVISAARLLPDPPRIISLEPTSIEEILETIRTVGRLADCEERAEEVVQDLRDRIERVSQAVGDVSHRPGTLCLEWLDPPMVGGHWVPEMVRCAGGDDRLGEEGKPSRRIDWEEIGASAPEVVVLMPCGYDAERTVAEYRRAPFPDLWKGVPAVKSGRVSAVDANAYFSRPGPRIVEGIEILGRILHPDRLSGGGFMCLDPS